MAIVPGMASDDVEVKVKGKKAKAEKPEKKESFAGASLVKEYGDSVFIGVDFLLDEQKEILSVSPACDIALNGGVPMGGMLILSGKSGTGKTTTALQIVANAQQANPNRLIIYADVEHRLCPKNLKGVHGLVVNPEYFKVVQSTQEKILSAEDYINILITLIKDNPGCIVIVDSASALCGESEQSDKVKANMRSPGPKLMAGFCRQIAPILRVNKCLVIILQHMIANTGGMGGPSWVEDGGEKIKYHADVRMRIKYIEKWKEGETQVGQIIHWEIVKSALGGPVEMFDSYLRYGYGLDDVWEIINLACDIQLITKGGAWYTLSFVEGEEKPKIQGQEKLYQYLRSNEAVYQVLHNKVKEALK
jgi:recombination protein RecA